MAYAKSKSVREGYVVSIRGGKIIKCSRLATPAGVWMGAKRKLYRTLDGFSIEVLEPEGIQVYGDCQVSTGISRGDLNA